MLNPSKVTRVLIIYSIPCSLFFIWKCYLRFCAMSKFYLKFIQKLVYILAFNFIFLNVTK